MTPVKHRFRRMTRAFRRGEDGNATIQFAIMFPIFLTIFLSSFEIGILMIRQMTLERSVDKTIRELRLGQIGSPTQEKLRTIICSRASLIPDCTNSLLIELRPVSTVTWTPLASETTCRNRSIPINPPDDYVEAGDSSELVLIRVCAVFDPIFPTTKLGMSLKRDDLGGYAIVASSAFVNEPR